jgi:UDP-glucose 4-epimerase
VAILKLKVLVTGGAGFIGSWVVEKLLAEGDEVLLLDDFSTGDRRNLEHLMENTELSILEGDIRDRAIVDQAAAEADATVHLAAVPSVGEAAENPGYACAVNTMGTLNLLDAARWNSHSRFVYGSSVAVYGEPKVLPVREDSPMQPLSVYGASKLAGEAFAHSFRTTYGLSTIALRFSNVYGPRQRAKRGGVIQRFIEESTRKKSIEVTGDGRQTRDFVYVEDAAEAFNVALRSDATGPYNIGTGKATSVNELAGLFSEMRPGLKVVRVRERPGDVRFSRVSSTKAAKALGWRARVQLKEGVERCLEHLRLAEQPKRFV